MRSLDSKSRKRNRFQRNAFKSNEVFFKSERQQQQQQQLEEEKLNEKEPEHNKRERELPFLATLNHLSAFYLEPNEVRAPTSVSDATHKVVLLFVFVLCSSSNTAKTWRNAHVNFLTSSPISVHKVKPCPPIWIKPFEIGDN